MFALWLIDQILIYTIHKCGPSYRNFPNLCSGVRGKRKYQEKINEQTNQTKTKCTNRPPPPPPPKKRKKDPKRTKTKRNETIQIKKKKKKERRN